MNAFLLWNRTSLAPVEEHSKAGGAHIDLRRSCMQDFASNLQILTLHKLFQSKHSRTRSSQWSECTPTCHQLSAAGRRQGLQSTDPDGKTWTWRCPDNCRHAQGPILGVSSLGSPEKLWIIHQRWELQRNEMLFAHGKRNYSGTFPYGHLFNTDISLHVLRIVHLVPERPKLT